MLNISTIMILNRLLSAPVFQTFAIREEWTETEPTSNIYLCVKSKPHLPFLSGLYFHSLVDHLWNIHLQDHKDQVFQRFPHNTPMIHTMKILQDVSLYKKLSDWEPIWHYFETILPQELQFGVSEGMVRLWHTTLSTYLRKPPDISDLEMLRMSLPGEMVEQIGKYYTMYRDDPFLKRFLRAFYDRIDPLIEHYAAQDLAS